MKFISIAVFSIVQGSLALSDSGLYTKDDTLTKQHHNASAAEVTREFSGDKRTQRELAATIGLRACILGPNPPPCVGAEGIIGADSCNGNDACSGLDAATLVGAASCVGDLACLQAAANVGAASCVGDLACLQAAAKVGAGSCLGTGACAFDSTKGVSTTSDIGAGACIGLNACKASAGLVGAGSCVGDGACKYAEGSVGAISCNDENACLNNIAVVGAGSCIGKDACTFAGSSPNLLKNGYTIGAASCLGEGACKEAASTSLGATIGAGSCKGVDACVGTGAFTIAAGSCTELNSCIGTNVDLIASGSCTGVDSCKNGAAGGQIWPGSCTGEGSCVGTQGDFNAVAGSCTGKESCIGSCGTKAAGTCTVAGSCNADGCPVIATLAPTAGPVIATLAPTAGTTMAPVPIQGGMVTLAQKWNITDSGFSSDSLSFELDFTVSSYIKNTMSQYSLWETALCQEGGENTKIQQTEPLTTVKLDPVQYNDQSDGTDGFPMDRTMTLNITIDSEKISSSNIYSEATIDNQVVAEVRFCVRFGLWTPQGSPIEVNFLETLVTLTVDLTDGFEIGSIATEPKDRLARTANQAYEVIGFECKATTDADADWEKLADLDQAQRRSQGDVIVVCVEPDQEAKDDGVFMRSVDDFFFYRGTAQGIRQNAVVNNVEAGTLLTSYDPALCIGSTQCRFETVLFALFYTSLGVVNGEGVASMQFGSGSRARRQLQLRYGGADAGRDLQDAAGAAEFDLNFQVNQRTPSDSGVGCVGAMLASAVAVLGIIAL